MCSDTLLIVDSAHFLLNSFILYGFIYKVNGISS